MGFRVRPVRSKDLDGLFDLSKQFVLLNLPSDRHILSEKIERSKKSFSKKIDAEKRKYIFVLEDLEQKRVIGASQIIAKKGTPSNPNYSFKILKKERFSPNLSVGFIHQILRLKIDEDGPSEIGGLVVDKNYRRRPEKIGRLLSLARFMYIKNHLEDFQPTIISEMAPPLTAEGRSEFWEALGRRFTGMPYQEADTLSSRNKDFIRSLFPEEDIYACLLDSKARLVMGQVSKETRPALHMLKKIGFSQNGEVDPFDGGPHIECHTDQVEVIRSSFIVKVQASQGDEVLTGRGMVAIHAPGEFECISTPFRVEGDGVLVVPSHIAKRVESMGEAAQVFCYVEKTTN